MKYMSSSKKKKKENWTQHMQQVPMDVTNAKKADSSYYGCTIYIKNKFILVSCLLSVNTVCSLAGKSLNFCHNTFCCAPEHRIYLFLKKNLACATILF